MNIFLTGGSGFIGKNFINFALNHGYKIFAVSRIKRKNKKNLVWLKGEINKDWNELKNCSILVHMASAGVENQNLSIDECLRVNVFQSTKLLLNAYKAGCKKWVIIGTSSEFGDTLKNKKKVGINSVKKPNNNYGLSKNIFSEIVINLAKKLKINCRYARLFQVYGEFEKKNRLFSSLKSIKKNKDFYIKNPYSIRDFISAKQVVKKVIEMTKFDKKPTTQVWHIASGNPISIKDFAKLHIDSHKKINFKINKKKINVENHISDKKSLWQ